MTNAYSSGAKYTGESKVNTVFVVVFATAELAVVEVCTRSGANTTSPNGSILEALGKPLTIGLTCNVTGR